MFDVSRMHTYQRGGTKSRNGGNEKREIGNEEMEMEMEMVVIIANR